MPFVDVNGTQPNSTNAASGGLPPLPGQAATLPIPASAPVAPVVTPAPVTEVPAEAPVQTLELVEAPVAEAVPPSPAPVETPAAVAPVTESQHQPGTIEFMDASMNGDVSSVPAEQVPVAVVPAAPSVPVVSEVATPAPQPTAEVVVNVVDTAESVPAAPEAPTANTIEVVPAEASAPASPVEVTAVPTPDVQSTVQLAQSEDDVNQTTKDIISFNSSPDAEDVDKPAEVKSPEIHVAEGVEIKAVNGGMREVVGLDFNEPAPSVAPQPVESSTPEAPADNTGSTYEQSETDMTQPLKVEPDTVNTDTVTMAADPLDLTAVSSVPTALPAPAAPALTALADVPAPASAPVAPIAPIASATAAPAAEALPDAGVLPSKVYQLNELLLEAINMGASDLHLTAGYRATARVDGKLAAIRSNVMDHETIKAMVTEVLKGRKVSDIEKIRDYDLSYSLPDGSARFRVNIFRQQESLAMVLRLIPGRIQSLEALKLPPVIKEFTKFASGLVLFTGPTGSGKSTTIAALLNEINMSQPKHIVTIEDPVEYVYPHGIAVVDQREIFTDTDSWGDALRSVLRQDPDVVLIGEMRDLETISSAIRVAETGHLVFATLHTNSAAQSIDRIIDVFPEGQQTQVRTQLASVIQAIVSQRLIPITGGGRRVATEILVATPAVRNAIRDDKVYQIDNMIQTSAELGMVTMEKSLVGLVREGLISTEQAQEYSNKPSDVLTLLGQNK